MAAESVIQNFIRSITLLVVSKFYEPLAPNTYLSISEICDVLALLLWVDDSIFTFPIFNSICVRVNKTMSIIRVIKYAIRKNRGRWNARRDD